jgi:hypothetical protein
MDRMQREIQLGFAIGLSIVLAGCAVRAGEPPIARTPATPDSRRSCTVTVFPGVPPFAVEDLGPVQASCPDSTRHSFACGIDQANLPEVACSSGADTVFGLYEVLTPAEGPFSSGGRVMHARLGRRRPEVGQASTNQDRSNRLK